MAQPEQILITAPNVHLTTIKWTLENFPILASLDNIQTMKLDSNNFTLTQSTQICSLRLAICKDPSTEIGTYKIKFILEACQRDSINLIINASIMEGTRSAKKVVKASSDARKVVDLFDIPDKNILSYLTNSGNSSLSIECEIRAVESIQSEIFETAPPKRLPMVKNFAEFYKKREFCDVSFIVGDDILQAHKLVLMGISAYFEGLLSNDSSDMRVIDFSGGGDDDDDDDVTAEVLEAFLDYVYGCKEIAELAGLAFELMRLAHRFHVWELLGAAELVLLDSIDESNVGRLLLFSKKNQCDLLHKRALAFAKTCPKKLALSEEFAELSKDKVLMSQLF